MRKAPPMRAGRKEWVKIGGIPDPDNQLERSRQKKSPASRRAGRVRQLVAVS
jgi:hypothetical protein